VTYQLPRIIQYQIVLPYTFYWVTLMTPVVIVLLVAGTDLPDSFVTVAGRTPLVRDWLW
jgi:hypothetical protein